MPLNELVASRAFGAARLSVVAPPRRRRRSHEISARTEGLSRGPSQSRTGRPTGVRWPGGWDTSDGFPGSPCRVVGGLSLVDGGELGEPERGAASRLGQADPAAVGAPFATWYDSATGTSYAELDRDLAVACLPRGRRGGSERSCSVPLPSSACSQLSSEALRDDHSGMPGQSALRTAP